MAPARFPSGFELRAGTEVRAAGRRLVGRAASFGQPAMIGGRFEERIAPGAFAKSLISSPDILALADHDPGKLLGRTRSGTLRLHEDGSGLNYEIDVPRTQLGDDVLHLAQRGDLGGMSFGFIVPPGGESWSVDGQKRTLHAIDLAEISVVSSWPAYAGTTVAARSLSDALQPDPRTAMARAEAWRRTLDML